MGSPGGILKYPPDLGIVLVPGQSPHHAGFLVSPREYGAVTRKLEVYLPFSLHPYIMMKYIRYSSLKHILWPKPVFGLSTWEAAPGLCVLLLVAVSNRSSQEPRLCASGFFLNPSPLGWIRSYQEQQSLPLARCTLPCASVGVAFHASLRPLPLIHTF